MKRILQAANLIALIATIIINYLSSAGKLNGVTVADISDKYHNLFTPAGYAFSIWGLIYLGLTGFVIYTAKDLFSNRGTTSDEVLKIGWWFVLSCFANGLWIIFWVNNLLGFSVIVMLFLLLCLVKIMLNLNMEMDPHPFKKYLFVFWPFSIYAGWITVAFIANVAAWLTSINWPGFGLSAQAWTIIMIVIAGLINILLIWKRNLREAGLAGIWALIAIGLENVSQHYIIAYLAYGMAGILLINIIVHGLQNKNRSIRSM